MRIDLNKDWKLRAEDLSCGVESFKEISSKKEEWLITDVPCDIREPLIRDGLIEEPLDGLNCFDSEWIENKSWWFKKTFNVPNDILSDDVIELVLESLDYGAEIFLNEQWIGNHLSSFYPFKKNVKKLLKEGKNELIVRLTTGVERVNEEELKNYIVITEEDRRSGRGDKRRAFLRKPQYSFGWDWSPKVSTCGIMKDVWIESHSLATIRGVHTYVKTLEPQTNLGIEIEVENFHDFSTYDADINIIINFEGKKVASKKTNVLLCSGFNIVDMDITIPDAKLWWPNGMGEQPLYTVETSLNIKERTIEYPKFYYGIRKIELDLSKLDDVQRLFAVTINGERVFCKGGNWIPTDAIYSRVSDEKYEKLIIEAKEANFNMLRIWGGGLYERDAFYNYCDKHGILIWHDFMFACSEYPDDKSWFYQEVENEFEYQTKKLRNHPSLALWCGNNEIHWAFDEWWKDAKNFGKKIYNYLAPSIVRKNCPEIPYWNSSPYGGSHPNGSDIGDRHHWHDCMMNDDMEKRITPEEYDKVTAKFVSEYGYVGPLKKDSIKKYLKSQSEENVKNTNLDINSEKWQHHNNTFEKDTVLAGIKYHYIDTENIDIDSYLLYAGLCQGLMYGYSLESFRYKLDCSGGLFWMFNDCWGETGWTIIDYYLTRKISYYFVKRAFAPIKFIMREVDGMISVISINETDITIKEDIEYGYISFDGTKRDTNILSISLSENSRKQLIIIPKGEHKTNSGVYFVKAVSSDIPLATLRTSTFRELKMSKTEILIKDLCKDGKNVKFTVESSCYAHAVHFNFDDGLKLSDEYFDLLPKDKKTITVYDASENLILEDIKVFSIN